LQRKLARRFERFLAEERHFAFEPVLVHADLWKDHVILKMREQQVSGIIDFGDVGIGDPAMDVWLSLLPYYDGKVDEPYYLAIKKFEEVIFSFRLRRSFSFVLEPVFL